MTMFNQDQLEAAFAKVQDPTDWRAPIDAVVRGRDIAVVCEAIVHFTASRPHAALQRDGSSRWRVTADGYRAGPAGP